MQRRLVKDRLNDLLRRFFLWPAFGGVTTVFGVVAGYLGSHYDQRIAAALYPIFWPGGTLEIPASLFWLVTFLFGASFSGTFWAQSKSSSENNAEMKESVKRLFTMPPKSFLHLYRNFSNSSTDFVWEVPASLTVADLQKAVRVQLEYIGNVVRAYDADGSVASYGCNVMTYVGVTSAKFAGQQADLQSRIKCIETGVAVSNLAGVLDLQLSLSIHSETSFAPDSHLAPLALPIPHFSRVPTPDYPNVLPGAPYAFAAGTELVFSNPGELVDKVARNRAFSSTVLEDMKALVARNSNRVQTLICIPLYNTAPPGALVEPIGVLNIHSSMPDPYAARKFELLLPLLTPFVRNLGNLVKQLP